MKSLLLKESFQRALDSLLLSDLADFVLLLLVLALDVIRGGRKACECARELRVLIGTLARLTWYLYPLVLPLDPGIPINLWLKWLPKPCLSQLPGNEDEMQLCFSSPLSWKSLIGTCKHIFTMTCSETKVSGAILAAGFLLPELC